MRAPAAEPNTLALRARAVFFAIVPTIVAGLAWLAPTEASAQQAPPNATPPTADAGAAPAPAETSTEALPPAPPPPPPAPVVEAPPSPPAPSAAAAGQAPAAATVSPTLLEASHLTGTPDPNALAPSTGDEWRFSSHGYFRAPLRIGVGERPGCPPGSGPGTAVNRDGVVLPEGATGIPCAGPDQSTTNLHSPFVPDDQYLDWRYTRQWEKDWTEIFLNYGNSKVIGTVGLMAFNLTDASFNNNSAQWGIAQAFLTIRPDFGISGLRVEWKVGSFWNKYGGSGKYDAGRYDVYMFGRTHMMGETLAAEYDLTPGLTLKVAHGFGTKAEQIAFVPLTPPLPGFTLINHVHAGVSINKTLDVNAHYLSSWTQDARATPTVPDGKIDVVGAEARLTGGVLGDLYGAYSHVGTEHAQVVGPAIEVVHSLGGGGYTGSANGIVDNYLGACGTCAPNDVGSGSVDSILLQYDYSFGLLYRKLKDGAANFWGEGVDLNLSLFGMYSAVNSLDKTGNNPLVGDGVKKLKYGADLVFTPLSWFGLGARTDIVQPSSKDTSQSFVVVSPKLLFHTRWITHEEITLQYSRYSYGRHVSPQLPNQVFAPDENVFGMKATMWW